jgi:putative hydrolase of the HAD superfamily
MMDAGRARSGASVEAVLFDLYGTLVDIDLDETSPAFWEGLAAQLDSARAGVAPGQLQLRYLDLCRAEAARGGRHLLERVFRELLRGLGQPTSPDDVERLGEFFRASSARTFRVEPYAAPLLASIRRSGCRVGLVSNTEAVLTRFDLRRSGLAGCFDAIVLSSEEGLAKPDPRIFAQALALLGVSAERTVFVGNDLHADIAGAQGAGLRAVYVNPAGSGFAAGGLRPRPQVVGASTTLGSVVAALEQLGWAGPDRPGGGGGD